jgi:hypothetical protein
MNGITDVTTSNPDSTPEFPSNELEDQPYYCCAEWHLARMSPSCRLIHPFALRLARSSQSKDRYSASAARVGPFFGFDECTIRRGYDDLERIGFFELLEKGCFRASSYRVLNHDQWAKKHPGQCVSKTQYPWSGEGDALGQALSLQTAFTVKFQKFQIDNIRKLGFSDEEVIERFTEYRAIEGQYKKAKNVPVGFYLWLKRAAKDANYAVQKCPPIAVQNLPL